MEDKIKSAVEIITRCIITEIVEEMVMDVFKWGYDEQKEKIKAVIRSKAEGALVDIVWKGRVDTIWATK